MTVDKEIRNYIDDNIYRITVFLFESCFQNWIKSIENEGFSTLKWVIFAQG